MSSPISALFSPSFAANPSIYESLSSRGIAAHSGKASLAALIAKSTSSFVPAGVDPITSSVEGLITSILSDPLEEIQFPST